MHTMIHKMLFAALCLLAAAACDKDSDPDSGDPVDPWVRYGGTIPQEARLTYLGTATVTPAEGSPYTNEQALFEVVGLGGGEVALYMDQIRFAAAMPALDIRLPQLGCQAEPREQCFVLAAERIVPEADIAGTGYRPVERYVITGLDGTLHDQECVLTFTCMGSYAVAYRGRLTEEAQQQQTQSYHHVVDHETRIQTFCR